MKHALLTLLLLISVTLSAKTIRVLAIGNSFSEDAVEQYLYELCAENGDQLIIGNAYRGGQGLESHWKVVVNQEPAFSYRKIVKGKKTTSEKRTLTSIVIDEEWDIITFQQVSQDAGLYRTFEPFQTNLIRYVKAIATNKNPRIGFHMTWAYPQYSKHGGFKSYNNDQMTMYNAIRDAVRQNLEHHPDIHFVIPSGTAVQNARATYLGDHLNRDGFHLDLGIGRYIAACTWAEALTGKSCVGKKFRPAKVTAKDALTAQKAAHAAVKTPYKLAE